MAVHTTTSIREVMARVVRNTRIQDSSLLADMGEWIPEAMGYMKTKMSLVNAYEDIKIHDHKGRMPCGLHTILAIEHCGKRLRYYNSIRSAKSYSNPAGSNSYNVYPGVAEEGMSVYGSYLVKRPAINDGSDTYYFETDIRKVMSLDESDEWYFDELDYINTSFEDGYVRVHFKKLPVDSKGFPLIPDDEFYKEALYYYSRAKMIGAGLKDNVFTEQVCMDRFESYAQKAMYRLKSKTQDQMESMVGNLQRLIMPQDYWASFNDPAPEIFYNGDNPQILIF